MATKKVVIVPETTVVSTKAASSSTGWKDCSGVPDLSFLTPGETYIVNFCLDGVQTEYVCLCKADKKSVFDFVWIGNGLQYRSDDSGEPFTMACQYLNGNTIGSPMYLDADSEGVEATFSIYQEVEEPGGGEMSKGKLYALWQTFPLGVFKALTGKTHWLE